MRINVDKFLFVGATKDKKAFFDAAQTAGLIEFIDPKGTKYLLHDPEIEQLVEAVKVLRGYVQIEQDVTSNHAPVDVIVNRVLSLKEIISTSETQKKETEKEYERIVPFGDFSAESVAQISEEIKTKIRFFCAKTSKHIDKIDPNLIFVNRKEGIDYFIAILNEPVIHPDLIEVHFSESLTTIQNRLDTLTDTLLKAAEELKELTKYDWLLHQTLARRVNVASLEHAKKCSEAELDQQLFYIEGWIPRMHVAAVKKLAAEYSIYLERVAPYPNEKAPVYLENKGLGKVGEDLVRVFDTPSIKDKDPSLWVIFAFSLFFSMIVYDGGYGLVFLATALCIRFRKKVITPQIKRLVTLMIMLAVSCTLWGGFTHSYFGIDLSPDNALRKYSLMTWLVKKKAAYHMAQKDEVYQELVAKYPQLADVNSPREFIYTHNSKETAVHTPISDKFTDNILMETVLLLGCIHICLGLMRYIKFNPSGAGWIAFIIGAYLYIPYYLDNTSIMQFVFGLSSETLAVFGLDLIFFGLAVATIIGIIQHGIVGIFEFVHSVQVFADVLSYLRIYALGLAGFIVSETVNELALKMPLLLTILLIIFGHLLNILLAVMGGTIHGLRLNFLEWYRYSFYGGGKEFQPLKLQTLE